MLKNKYSLEFKIMVVKYYLNHHTVRETLNEFGIAESVLFTTSLSFSLETPTNGTERVVRLYMFLILYQSVSQKKNNIILL